MLQLLFQKKEPVSFEPGVAAVLTYQRTGTVHGNWNIPLVLLGF